MVCCSKNDEDSDGSCWPLNVSIRKGALEEGSSVTAHLPSRFD